MTDFQTRLVKHLSSELDCKAGDVTKALNTFTKTPKVQKKPPVIEKHTCERVPRGHDKPCGKRAKNEIELMDGTKHWYCGTAKSGCSKSVWSMIDKEKQKKAAENIFKETVSKKSNTGKDRKERADKKTESFLKKKKIVREIKLQCRKIKTKTNGALHMDYNTRILFDQETKEAYGVLGKDNDTIKPLGKKEKDWLEVHNFPFKQKLKEKVDSDSDDDSEGHSDSGDDSDSDEEIDLDDM